MSELTRHRFKQTRLANGMVELHITQSETPIPGVLYVQGALARSTIHAFILWEASRLLRLNGETYAAEAATRLAARQYQDARNE